MASDPAELTAAEALAALRSGELSVRARTQACLARIADRDGEVSAWVHLDPDAVLKQAAALDALPPEARSPLHGLPIGVKDVIHTRDMPTRYNSPLYADPPPTPDAACVARLRAAGAVILGKTATVEFAAIGRPADTRNPHDLARTPGGSSSGSAAAVADGHAPLALGTQTGGVDDPAGLLLRRVGDEADVGAGVERGLPKVLAELGYAGVVRPLGERPRPLLDVLDPAGARGPAPPASVDRLSIALCPTPMWDAASPDVQAAFSALWDRLKKAGAIVVDLPPIEGFDRLPALQRLVMRAEGRVAFQAEREGLEGAMRDMVEGVDVASDAELAAALDEAGRVRTAFDRAASPFDVVLTPSAIGEAPAGLASTGDLLFNGLWTMLHAPCVNLPGALGAAGLPVGLTLTGARFCDRRVLRAAEAIAGLTIGSA